MIRCIMVGTILPDVTNNLVLVVEDSLTQAEKLKHALVAGGFQVEYAESGEVALELLHKISPAMVISDIIMPGIDGYNLCKKIRSDPKKASIPVILLTSLFDSDYIIHALECGANGFITKPYQDSYLIDRINDILEIHNIDSNKNSAEEINFIFSGRKYKIKSDRLQILEVLTSTYNTVLENNEKLTTMQKQLQDLNGSLERSVQQRTLQLQAEIEERKLKEQYLKAQQDLNSVLAESVTLDERSSEIFSIISKISGCDMCCLWSDSQHGKFLKNTTVWASKNFHPDRFIEYTQKTTYTKTSDEQIGKVWATGKMEHFSFHEAPEVTSRATNAYLAGFRTWLLIPITIRESSFLLMEVLWRDHHNLTEELLHILKNISVQVGVFIEHAHLQQQFFQSQKMESIGQLTGGIAHDLNNILMIIQGNVELLEMVIGPEHKGIKYLHTVLSAIERGSEFNKRLLAFSRKQILQPQVTNIFQTINNAVKLLVPILGESIEIKEVMADNLFRVFVDQGQLENALVNLAVNAKDAMEGHGKLTIEATNVIIDDTVIASKYEVAPNDYVKISITDTGSGIAQELLDRIFEPFFTTKAVGKGTGLGLSMVYGFVKQSKGHVTVYSEVNHGTTFNLYLPRVNEKEDVNLQPIVQSGLITGTEKILVAEDETELLQLVAEYLRNLGYTVLTASNPLKALEILKAVPDINLLFTDIVMPGELAATDFAQKARLINPTLKILFTSGYPLHAIENSTDKINVFENFLAKPYKIQDLGIKVRQLLDTP